MTTADMRFHMLWPRCFPLVRRSGSISLASISYYLQLAVAGLHIRASKQAWKTPCFDTPHAHAPSKRGRRADMQLPVHAISGVHIACAGNRSNLRLRLPRLLPMAVNALSCDAAATSSRRYGRGLTYK